MKFCTGHDYPSLGLVIWFICLDLGLFVTSAKFAHENNPSAKWSLDAVRHKFTNTIRVMHNGIEQDVERRLTPKYVFRAIMAQSILWQKALIQIITESRFKYIAMEWEAELSRIDSILFFSFVVLENVKMAQDLSILKPGPIQKITIILLSPKYLRELYRQKSFKSLIESDIATGNDQTIIIGRCIPNFIKRYRLFENLRLMIVPVSITDWVHGIIKKKKLTIFSIYRQSKRKWKTFPFKSILPYKLLETSVSTNGSLYRKLQNIFIHADMFQVKNIVELKAGKLIGIFGTILTYIAEYLQISIQLRSSLFNEQDEYIHRMNAMREDLHIGSFIIKKRVGVSYLPPLLHDGQTVFGIKRYEPFTFGFLFSLLKRDVWIILLLVILTFNICFHLAHDNSPSIRHHPRIKNRNMNRIYRILLLDSLVRFQTEWHQGPNLCTRWLNVAFSFLTFMALSYYLTIFSVKILSDRAVFPFSDVSYLCNGSGEQVAFANDAASFIIYVGCLEVSKLGKCHEGIIDASATAELLFAKTISGEHYILSAFISGKNMFQNFPNISSLKHPDCYEPASMETSSDFIFFDIFSALILRIKETGISRRLILKYTSAYSTGDDAIIRAKTFFETWFTFVILGIGTILALITVYAERFIYIL